MTEKKHRFTGDGMLQTPIEGEEAARHRDMYRSVEQRWDAIDDAVTGRRSLDYVVKMVPKIGIIATAFGVLGAWAKSQGWV